jgi:hypothetical protein
VTLIAVSKTFPADIIEPVLAAGHRVFGENYVEGVVGVLVTLLGRAVVYAPRTVKAADSAFLDVHLGDEMVADDEQG